MVFVLLAGISCYSLDSWITKGAKGSAHNGVRFNRCHVKIVKISGVTTFLEILQSGCRLLVGVNMILVVFQRERIFKGEGIGYSQIDVK